MTIQYNVIISTTTLIINIKQKGLIGGIELNKTV